MRLPSMSIRTRFVLTFSLVVLALSAALTAFIGWRAAQQVREEIGLSLADMAGQMADKLDRGVWARAGEIRTLARLGALRAQDDPEGVRLVLEELQRSFPYYAFLGLTDAEGKVVASAGGLLQGANISHRPVFIEGSKGLFLGDVHDAVMLAKLIPNPSGEPMKFVDVSAPVLRADGSLAGVLASHLSWQWARGVKESVLSPMESKRGVDMFVVAKDDAVVLGMEDSLGETLRLKAVDEARAGHLAWTVEAWPDGKTYLTGAAYGKGQGEGANRYEGLGWTVVARQPLDVAYAPIRSMAWEILIAGAALSLLFGLFGLVAANHVARPIETITDAARRLSSGENVPIPMVRGVTDIEILSSALSDMVDNITRVEAARSRMEVLATRDPLTGLYNRLGLEQHLETAIPRCARSGNGLTVLCLDLDGFKAVNDTMGHPAGDSLLREIAARLRTCLRNEDVAARSGGDEFVVVLESRAPDWAKEARLVAGRIIEAVNRPMTISDREARVGVSLGGACWPDDGEEFKEVLRNADRALYRAKHLGKNRLAIFGEESDGMAATETGKEGT